MKWTYLILLLSAVVWLGCGMVKPRTHTGDDEDCEYRTEVGSRVPVKVCESEDEKRQRAEDDTQALDQMQRNTFAEQPPNQNP